MASLRKKNPQAPDEVRQFAAHGNMKVMDLEDHTVGLATFEPGWKWSNDIKPVVGTEWCQGDHLSYVVSGRMKVVHQDGSEIEVGPGDVMRVPPGHDAWVVGDEPCVQVDFLSAATYAKARS